MDVLSIGAALFFTLGLSLGALIGIAIGLRDRKAAASDFSGSIVGAKYLARAIAPQDVKA